MSLLESHEALSWLDQFDTADRDYAAMLIGALELISGEVVEAKLQELLSNYALQHADEATALFVAEEPSRSGQTPKPYFDTSGTPHSGEGKGQMGSEGRLLQLSRNAARTNNMLMSHPTLDEMKKRQVKQILIIDDYSGSGNRILRVAEWLYADPHLKSIYSYGLIAFDAIVFAITASGVARLAKHRLIRETTYYRFGRTFESTHWSTRDNGGVRSVCRKYAPQTSRKTFPLGYGKTAGLTVLSYGCPNNVPAILWSQSSRWRALFSKQVVPENLRAHFASGDDIRSLGDRMRKLGRLSLADALDTAQLSEYSKKLVAVLSASTRYRFPFYRVDHIAMWTGVTPSETRALLAQAKEWNWIDSRGLLTEAGRWERQRLENLKIARSLPQGVIFHYPKSTRDQAQF